MQGFLAAARGLVIPSLKLVMIARGFVIPLLELAVVAQVLVIPSMRLLTVASLPGIGMPLQWLVAPCTRVVHAHCSTARLVLDSLGVKVACLTLDLAPAHGRPRRATVTAAIVGAGARAPGTVTVAPIVALAAVWHPSSGTQWSGAARFVVVTPVGVAAGCGCGAKEADHGRACILRKVRWWGGNAAHARDEAVRLSLSLIVGQGQGWRPFFVRVG